MVAMMGALNLTSWWGRPVMAGGEGPQFPSVPHHPIRITSSSIISYGFILTQHCHEHGTLLSTRDTYMHYMQRFVFQASV